MLLAGIWVPLSKLLLLLLLLLHNQPDKKASKEPSLVSESQRGLSQPYQKPCQITSADCVAGQSHFKQVAAA
jgi:hypothetical protein